MFSLSEEQEGHLHFLLSDADPVYPDYPWIIDSLQDEIRNTIGRLIVTGNFIARAVGWCPPQILGGKVSSRWRPERTSIFSVSNLPTILHPEYRETAQYTTRAPENIITWLISCRGKYCQLIILFRINRSAGNLFDAPRPSSVQRGNLNYQ